MVTESADLQATVEQLRKRNQALAKEKADYQFLMHLMTALAPLEGVQQITRQMLELMSGMMGGNNVILYYREAFGWHTIDLHARESSINSPDDPLVTRAIQRGCTCTDGTAQVPNSERVGSLNMGYFLDHTKGEYVDIPSMSLAIPLKVRDNVLGVIKFEDMLVHYANLTPQLENMSNYLALLLKNELSNAELLERANRTLHEQNEELLLAKQTREQLNTRLAQKNHELEQLVYIASHDLRSPLVNIDGYSREIALSLETLKAAAEGDASESGLRRAFATVKPDMYEALSYIRTSASRMDLLLKGLLRMSRLGRAALQISPLNMNTLMREILGSFEFEINTAGVEIQLEDLPPCRGDQVQVGQIFANLISNALKYLSPERRGHIQISGIDQGTQVCYFVADNGIGIDPAYQEKIFEPFHRLNPSWGDGEGLGLAIVRQALDRLNGSIQLDSRSGEGCRFLVFLPSVRSGKLEGLA